MATTGGNLPEDILPKCGDCGCVSFKKKCSSCRLRRFKLKFKTRLETIEQKLDECYNAPGMPGCQKEWEEVKAAVEERVGAELDGNI
jgi:hypothetical protein